MTREEYKSILLSKGFEFEKTVLSYPSSRGDEDIYTHKPEYKYTFRISRVFRSSPDYGLYVGVGNQFRALDAITEHDVDTGDWSKNETLPMWTGDAFKELMNKLP